MSVAIHPQSPAAPITRYRAIVFSADLSKAQLTEIDLGCKLLGVAVLASVREVEVLTTLAAPPPLFSAG